MKLTNEELLKLALTNGTPIQKTKFSGNDVLRFIDTLNIKEGKREVKIQFIYKAYKEWSYAPITLKDFKLKFREVFRQNNSDNDIWFNINLRPLELYNKVEKMKK